ncbi:glutamate-1-semialdehyde 2,1-aminomutase [Pelagicoccus sp. SDUM812003]|uniref:glutamate-1-semialdehyde 2,1-aminomutase n=1 Tax=Pelagicoccus sp. SDUM812003 TaxID=3041267 RepID=UPI00280FD9AE|nr:glutamate-1-semialdehyde 2,1-aminomutase [Pelagicoccus sp. SDUM812003]MDQ8203163.1 glutamate-1-semialdehyde 2,1-aminomutase [Pelagicoccus sp. SDUM812003]
MSTSNELFERAKKLIPGGVNSPVRAFRSVGGTPFFTKKANGATLTTADDRELIDFVCTWGPAIHGHNNDTIRHAIAKALEAGTSFGTPNPYEVEMAELIVKMVPSVEKVRMVNSGTEATMTAIRLARGYTGRDKIIKFAGCYHGHVDSLLISAGSGALTLGKPDSGGVPESLAKETIVLPFNDLAKVEAAFESYGDDIAGIILEPYPANVGLIFPKDGYLRGLRDLCSKHGAVLIFDEVMTGFRVSAGGVQEREGITPDLTTLGKIIGGGLPVGALGGKAEIMDHLAPLGPVYQAGTLSGNPLAMAAGIASLKLLLEGGAYAALETMGQQIAKAVAETAREIGLPLQVPQVASMFCVYFSDAPVETLDDATATDTQRFNTYFHRCLEKGVYLPPSKYEANFISTAHQQGAIDQACEILTETLREL